MLFFVLLGSGCIMDEMGTGSVSVFSDPRGGSVYLDGRYVATAPCNITDIPTGTHDIEIQLPGHIPWTASVRVSSGIHSTIRATMSPSDDLPPLPAPTDSPDTFYRSYAWYVGGDRWIVSLSIPKSVYEYYRAKPHNRENNYAQYALSDFDRPYLSEIVRTLRSQGEGEEYSEDENRLHIIAFVQSLPYVSDDVATPFDEYPRYPVETLVDGGGDCEDTSILAAALMVEMGSPVVLLEYPDHMAVGIPSTDPISGTFYDHQGIRYYYQETTGEGYSLGEVPPEYAGTSAVIRSMIQIPRMSLNFTALMEEADSEYVYIRVDCEIENLGPGTAKNPRVTITALAAPPESDTHWATRTIDLEDYEEGSRGSAETVLRVPRHQPSRIYIMLTADNGETVEAYSTVFEG